MCSEVAGLSSSGSGDLFELSDRSNETIILLFPSLLTLQAAIFDLSVTSNSHTAFGAYYSIMHKVYSYNRESLESLAYEIRSVTLLNLAWLFYVGATRARKSQTSVSQRRSAGYQ